MILATTCTPEPQLPQMRGDTDIMTERHTSVDRFLCAEVPTSNVLSGCATDKNVQPAAISLEYRCLAVTEHLSISPWLTISGFGKTCAFSAKY